MTRGTGPLTLPKRVLMTADAAGGVWTYALELARSLASHGVAVVLATMGPRPSRAQRDEAAAVPGLVLEESDFRLEWVPGAADDGAEAARAGDWLLGLAARHEPDLVHLNGFTAALLPWRVPCLVVAHSCVITWWRAVKGGDPPPEWRGYAQRVREGLMAAQCVVAPTANFLAALEAIYGRMLHARVIRNGLDPDAVPPAPRKEPLVFSAGRLWDEAKNIRALGAVAGSLPWPVMVAGDATGPDGTVAPPEAVRWLGPLEMAAVRDWMARAAIFALPARYEPFGLTALEAALSGCALVLGDRPTQRELWDGVALFVPPDDHTALTEALGGLIADPERTRALGRSARRRGLAYNTARMTAGYCEAYDDLLSGRLGVAAPPAPGPAGRLQERHVIDLPPAEPPQAADREEAKDRPRRS